MEKGLIFNIEIYVQGDKYGAYIGQDCSSGYKCSGPTKEECLKQISDYFSECFDNL